MKIPAVLCKDLSVETTYILKLFYSIVLQVISAIN